MVYKLLDDDPRFPDPAQIPEEWREEDGYIAFGGDLSPDRLIEAYAQGIFPWFPFRFDTIQWYCPMRRFVIFPDQVHISHSMRTLLNKGEYACTIDKDFGAVIDNCSQLRIKEYGAWLGPEMVKAYTAMHELGYGHSVEVWRGDELVGGLYGIQMGYGFMGESMFSLAPSASKVALIYLCRKFGALGGAFIDCQFETPHLRSMGGAYIPYSEYMRLLINGNKKS